MVRIARRSDRRRRPPSTLLNEVRSFSGFLTGERTGGVICYRSRIERDALALLEFDPAILRIERNDLTDLERAGLGIEPEGERYQIQTPAGRYTPDLRITLEDLKIFVEVGTLAGKTAERMAERLAFARVQIEAEGFGFVVLTEDDVRGTERASNCLGLLRYLLQPAGNPVEHDVVRRYLREPHTITEAAAQLSAVGKEDDLTAFATVWSVVARAAHEGKLGFDLDARVLDAHAPLAIQTAPPAIPSSLT